MSATTMPVCWADVHAQRDTTTALSELDRVSGRAERLALAAAVRSEALIAARASTRPPTSAPVAVRPVQHVLLIEDNAAVRARTAAAIVAAGMTCDAVGAGCDGCALVRDAAEGRRPTYDCVVTDYDLGPGCHGSAVLLETEKWLRYARRILWSGKLYPEELADAAFGAHAHLAIPKGTPASTLIAAIRGLEVSRET